MGDFYNRINIGVGNERKVKFWKDKWCDDLPVGEAFSYIVFHSHY